MIRGKIEGKTLGVTRLCEETRRNDVFNEFTIHAKNVSVRLRLFSLEKTKNNSKTIQSSYVYGINYN